VQRVATDKKWDQKKADAVIATLASADLYTSADLRALRSEDWRDLGLSVGVRRALQEAVKQAPAAGKIPRPIVPAPCMYLCLSGSASMSVRVFPVFILPSLSSVSVSVVLTAIVTLATPNCSCRLQSSHSQYQIARFNCNHQTHSTPKMHVLTICLPLTAPNCMRALITLTHRLFIVCSSIHRLFIVYSSSIHRVLIVYSAIHGLFMVYSSSITVY
jgi:hypothetical protein